MTLVNYLIRHDDTFTHLHLPPPIARVQIMIASLVILIIMPLRLKYHTLGKLSVAIEHFDTINNVSGINRYGFAGDLNIFVDKAGTIR
jgi:hypothetical protein